MFILVVGTMKKSNIDLVYKILKEEIKNYKVPVVELIEMQTKDPFKVLITTILSSRTKDRVTMKAARQLFSKVKKSQDLAKMTTKQIEKLIYPVGFYKTKAKHLKKFPKVLKQEFNNEIPKTLGELIKLPGVGRKTANLVLTVSFNKSAICVDTHVHKIMNRLGYLKTKNPFQTEMILRKTLPKDYWTTINSILVTFGQHTCTPISPFCSRCPVNKYCDKVGVKKQR